MPVDRTGAGSPLARDGNPMHGWSDPWHRDRLAPRQPMGIRPRAATLWWQRSARILANVGRTRCQY